MSLSNLTGSYNLTLDGLNTITADIIYLGGVDINTKISGDYYSKSQIDSLIALYYTQNQIDTTFTNYYNKSYIDTLISN